MDRQPTGRARGAGAGAMLVRRGNALVGLVALAVALTTPVGAGARQLSSSEFFKIRRGMNESELLIQAGQPDLVTYPGVVARETTIGGRESRTTRSGDSSATSDSFLRFRRTSIPEVKQYHYIPDKSEHDPYLTVITLRGGLVSRIDRTKVFSRDNLPEPPAEPAVPAEPVRSDIDIRRDRADRTYRAAQEYAQTRSRLLEERSEAAPQGAAPRTGVYRSVDEDGNVYFGDRPSRESVDER